MWLFHSLGLTDKEVPVYLSLLALGTAPASRSPSARVFPRSTVQFACHMRNIATQSPMSAALSKRDAQSLRETRCTESDMESSPSEVMVYGSKVCLVTVEKGAIFATVIENSSIADLLRAGFEDHWRRLR